MKFFTFIFFCTIFCNLFCAQNIINYTDIVNRGHLQGIAGDVKSIYRVFNHTIIKSDMNGKTLKIKDCKREKNRWFHAGSPCFVDGKLYVPCNSSGFNRDLNGRPSLNYIQVYDSELNYIKTFHIPELEHGAGCVTFADGKFFVSGGRPYQQYGNTIYEYDRNFKMQKKYDLNLTASLGIQTLAFDGSDFWLGCYGNGNISYKVSRDFKNISYYNFSSSIGMMVLGKNKMLISMPIGSNSAKIIDPEKYLLTKKYIDINEKCIGFFEGKEYIDLSALHRHIRTYNNTIFVVRCSRKIPFERWAAARQYIPTNSVIKIVD